MSDPTIMSVPARIRCTHVFPPIPMRNFDYCAYVDGDEEGLQGYGATEREAIADLEERLAELEP